MPEKDESLETEQEKKPVYALNFGDLRGCSHLYNALSKLKFDAEEYNEAAVVAATKQQLKRLLTQGK